MKQYVKTYIQASEMLFAGKKHHKNGSNPVGSFFANLTQLDVAHLDAGEMLTAEAIQRLAERANVSVEECRQKLDCFLYWRQHSLDIPG